MRSKVIYLFAILAVSVCQMSFLFSNANAQSGAYDVFRPIAKYIERGDVEKLSAWFADNLEISLISKSNDSSKNQAKQILKSFFDSYTPRSFKITHTAGRSNMKYALGTLNAGGEVFVVTIFVSCKGKTFKIQQLGIARAGAPY